MKSFSPAVQYTWGFCYGFYADLFLTCAHNQCPVIPLSDMAGAPPSSSDLPFNFNQAPSYRSGTALDIQDDDDQAANLCNKLWTEFERAMKLRERWGY